MGAGPDLLAVGGRWKEWLAMKVPPVDRGSNVTT
jgi:hypothetical protein